MATLNLLKRNFKHCREEVIKMKISTKHFDVSAPTFPCQKFPYAKTMVVSLLCSFEI